LRADVVLVFVAEARPSTSADLVAAFQLTRSCADP